LNPDYPSLSYAAAEVIWLHRIIWASQ